jgi:hypothetical protein
MKSDIFPLEEEVEEEEEEETSVSLRRNFLVRIKSGEEEEEEETTSVSLRHNFLVRIKVVCAIIICMLSIYSNRLFIINCVVFQTAYGVTICGYYIYEYLRVCKKFSINHKKLTKLVKKRMGSPRRK